MSQAFNFFNAIRQGNTLYLEDFEGAIHLSIDGLDRYIDKHRLKQLVETGLRAEKYASEGRKIVTETFSLKAVSKKLIALYKRFYVEPETISIKHLNDANDYLVNFDGFVEQDRPMAQICPILKDMESWVLKVHAKELAALKETGIAFRRKHRSLDEIEANEAKLKLWKRKVKPNK